MEPHPMISLGNPTGPVASSSDFFDDDEYCCGNFWKHLIDAGVVLPRNLLFLGVADYPGVKATPGWERFRKNYLDLEARGCNFFPLTEFQGRYLKRLQGFIQHKVTAPNVYVSLDLDVGAYRCVHAARYMDRMGVEREAIMDVARTIGNSSRSGKFRLAGFDVMECNVHFLGLETGDGTKDDTISTALDFIGELLLCRRGAEAGDENQGGGRRRKADRKQRAAE
jgi:arginase family enzyme